MTTYIYIYIYIYVRVCVCVCIYIYIVKMLSIHNNLLTYSSRSTNKTNMYLGGISKILVIHSHLLLNS